MNDVVSQINEWAASHRAWMWPVIIVFSFTAAFVVKFVLKSVSKRLRPLAVRTTRRWDNVFVDLIDGLKFAVLFVWTFYLLSHLLQPTDDFKKLLQFFLVVFSTYQVGIWGLHVIRNWREDFIARKTAQDSSSAGVLGLMFVGIQSIFLCMLVVVGLNNMGINVGALIAGLGVGGIAVALAAQNILGDLLASLSIVLDKPFLVGDFIIVGNDMGTIEKIGIKTTRVRSLSGEELIFSNKDLLENRIRNYKRMWQRRVVQTFGVAYGVSADAIENIPIWIKGFIEKHRELKFDRCHFMKFNTSSLDFEFVFWVASSDYNVFMDLQQKVLVDMMRKFEDENIPFAIPAQVIRLDRRMDKLNSRDGLNGISEKKYFDSHNAKPSSPSGENPNY